MATSTSREIIFGGFSIFGTLVTPIVVGLVVGIVLWWVTSKSKEKEIKADAIRDLMTYRGDLASTEFQRALNKVSITFHDNGEIRNEVRHLYEVINNPSSNTEHTKRSIVGLIYKLCQNNGFKGLTEYDIDQAFSEKKQTPSFDDF